MDVKDFVEIKVSIKAEPDTTGSANTITGVQHELTTQKSKQFLIQNVKNVVGTKHSAIDIERFHPLVTREKTCAFYVQTVTD